jgi:hypothetical protein
LITRYLFYSSVAIMVFATMVVFPKYAAPGPLDSLGKESEDQTQEDSMADNLHFSSQTTIRTFNRDTEAGNDSPVLPLYQYLGLDFEDAEEGGWSLHAYGYGRKDLADSGFFEEDADGELLYGYLEYKKPYSALGLKLGRQHIFAGVTNRSIDGIEIAAGWADIISAALFGGVTASSEETSSDTTYGGRIALHPQPNYELGLSYQKIDTQGVADNIAGADIFFSHDDWLTLQGLSSINLESEDWREHSYSAALRYNSAVLEPSFQTFSYKDYFGEGTEQNNLFHFLKNSEEQITIVGADVHWQGLEALRVGARYNVYRYEVRQEAAAYLAALLSVNLPGSVALGFEAGRMDGDTPDNRYNLYRGYFHWDDPFLLKTSAFVSADAIYQDYEEMIFDKDASLSLSLSSGMHFLDDRLELKITGLYAQDPYFDEDIQGIVTLLFQN